MINKIIKIKDEIPMMTLNSENPENNSSDTTYINQQVRSVPKNMGPFYSTRCR